MPNIDSAKKRSRQSREKRDRNNARKTSIKTSIRYVIDALESNEVDKAKELLKKVESRLSRAAQKGTFHKNKASRKTSRLHHRIRRFEDKDGSSSNRERSNNRFKRNNNNNKVDKKS